MTPKQRAWKSCSRYVRLRDALAYCKKMGIDPNQYDRVEDLPIKCCTCGRVRSFWQMDAGHFISRGSGGGSGVYFDERNVNAQCKHCNAFLQGNALAYLNFMLEKYGQKVIDELELKDKIIKMMTRESSIIFPAIYQYYKDAYEELLRDKE